MKIDNILLDKLTDQAKESPRLRMNLDLRTQAQIPGQAGNDVKGQAGNDVRGGAGNDGEVYNKII